MKTNTQMALPTSSSFSRNPDPGQSYDREALFGQLVPLAKLNLEESHWVLFPKEP